MRTGTKLILMTTASSVEVPNKMIHSGKMLFYALSFVGSFEADTLWS